MTKQSTKYGDSNYEEPGIYLMHAFHDDLSDKLQKMFWKRSDEHRKVSTNT